MAQLALLFLVLTDAFPSADSRWTVGAMDGKALEQLVEEHVRGARVQLEAARARGPSALDEALGAVGVPPRLRGRAVTILEQLPRFDDGGKALNAAAAQLVESKQRAASGAAAPPIATLPGAKLAEGLWKYVLLEVRDAPAASRTVARNYANFAFHAEMARVASRAISAWNAKLA